MTAVLATFQTALFGRFLSYHIFVGLSGTIADFFSRESPKILLYNINRGILIFNAKIVFVHRILTLQYHSIIHNSKRLKTVAKYAIIGYSCFVSEFSSSKKGAVFSIYGDDRLIILVLYKARSRHMIQPIAHC